LWVVVLGCVVVCLHFRVPEPISVMMGHAEN
jgi:hypothetical protein